MCSNRPFFASCLMALIGCESQLGDRPHRPVPTPVVSWVQNSGSRRKCLKITDLAATANLSAVGPQQVKFIKRVIT
ncbi:hypothetical protein DFP92_101200 [Yoonia sediminilitoris]|uniref:Lipoprotein n=1 Tax=Yoonia sediminilitoris TaxID=1286148 RepID=A0A2T6KPX5_9RHOB|nr:hypothetical protein C8N45_101200 [Yoonia sediminilitoris]RCW98784.1 hypothetical protein DFP92_101200 [Yoonia sediminilitoris]